jgi:GntR family transcriptional regulator
MESGLLGTMDPLKTRLHRELKERIANGHYAPGIQLPSEAELVERYGVSRSTVRSALSALEAEGLIVRRWGVGTFVCDRQHIANPLTEAVDFRELIAASGFAPGVTVGQAAMIKADSGDATDLAVPEGSILLRIEKIFRADEHPVIYVVNRIPAWVLGEQGLRDTAAHPEVTEPIYRFLEDMCRQQIDHHVATLRALLVRDCEIPVPGVDPITPVLTMSSIAYNREGRPVFESRSTYPDQRVQLKLFRRQGR